MCVTQVCTPGHALHSCTCMHVATVAQACIHVAQTVQPLDGDHEHPNGTSKLIKLAFAAPHVHVSAISLELQDALTNETICKVSRAPGDGVLYGAGKSAGDELHYLTGLRPCTWSAVDAPLFKRSHPMRTIATYNATQRQGGVMALWLMDAADQYP